MRILLNCSRKRFFNWPTVLVQTRRERSIVYAGLGGPLAERVRFAVKGKEAIRSLVVALHFRSGPSDISRLVIAVIVGIAIEGMLRAWWVSHIGIEIFKGLPTLTNLNSTATILVVIGVFGIFAAVLHVRPSSPRLRPSHAVSIVAFAGSFFLQAATALGMTIDQIFCGYSHQRPAITPTFPCNSVIGASTWAKPQNRQSAESFARMIRYRFHTPILFEVGKKVYCKEAA